MSHKVVYQKNSKGFYVGEVVAYDELIPANAVEKKPMDKDGFIAKWNGKNWEYIENHIGEKGYVNNQFFEITEYGPYPKGWANEYIKTPEEIYQEEKQNIIYRLNAIDTKVIRPLMLITDNEATEEDKAVYNNLKEEKKALQKQMQVLEEAENSRINALKSKELETHPS